MLIKRERMWITCELHVGTSKSYQLEHIKITCESHRIFLWFTCGSQVLTCDFYVFFGKGCLKAFSKLNYNFTQISAAMQDP